ncbi:MAG: hypothetical protein K1X89_11875 [Myxococcaceae bacterium]|nr:hypothetical protein [Myxococcaceae bacterium]
MRAPLLGLLCGLLLSFTGCGPEALEEPLGESALDLAAGQRKVALTPGADDHAELVKLLPVARSEAAASRHVALQLTPAQLPHLAPGDRLTVAAEVQVTTRCDVGQVAPGCDYDPHVKAQLILTGDPNGKDASGPGAKVLATQSTQCSKAEHHCMFVFRPGQTSTGLDRLPCMANDSCRVNLVLWAWHPDARSDGQDEVLVGGNDHDFLQNHKVEGDVSRLMAVRERGVRAQDRDVRETSGSGTMSVNTTARAEVVYSQRLTSSGLEPGEQFLIEAEVQTDVGGRVRFSTELMLAPGPEDADGRAVDEVTPKHLGEQNGFNCTSRCTTHKVAVFRVDRPLSGSWFVNVVAKSEVPGGGSTSVRVNKAEGFVRTTRWGAQLAK